MDIHYSAFISYRHHPQDMKVAEEIQRRLERFRVPGALKKQGKKIERLFRDKDELPITSSLTDTITMALENSDYLIVICSTHLKESYWCQREIETFLKTHTKDQILTVLVDGENPYDVIPEILTYNEVVDPVTGETVREPIEPLSCDWRLPGKRAVKEELPRLAAALLGCTYDELRQRQRQYKMRRLITMFSVGFCAALALAGYFLYSSIQIQKSLNESLRNQSQYLASASKENYSDGDRLTAIALALEALPNEDRDRPYIAYAEQALTDALSLYDATEQVISVAVFDAKATISDFVVTDDAHTLYILDDRGIVTSWDTFSFEKLASFGIGGTKYPLMTTANGSLLILCDDANQTIRCFDRKGEVLWEMENCLDTALCEGKQTLYVLQSEGEQNADFSVFYRHFLLRLDPENGQLLEDPIYLFDSEIGDYLNLESDIYYDNRLLYVSATLNGGKVRCLVDLRSGEVRQLLSGNEQVYSVSMTESGRVFMLISDGSGAMNGRWQNYFVYSPAGAILYCFDGDSAEILWTAKLETYMHSSQRTIAEIPGTGNIICQYGNTYCQLDGNTGEMLMQCMAPASPLVTDVGDTDLWSLYADGSAGSYYYASNEIVTIQYMNKTLLQGALNRGLYTLEQLDTRVVLYRSTADESREIFSGTFDEYVSKVATHGDYLLIEGTTGVHLFNMATRQMLWSRELGDMGRMLGFSPDGGKIIYCNPQLQITELDVLSGEASNWTLSAGDSMEYSIRHASVQMTHNGYVFLVDDRKQEQMCIAFCGGDGESVEVYPFLTEEEVALGINYAQSYVEFVGERYVLVFTPENNLYLFDRSDNQSRLVLEELAGRPIFLMEEDEDRLTVALDHEILVLNGSGDVIQTIALPDISAVSFCRENGELLAVCDDGKLYRFDGEGQKLTATDLALFDSFYIKIGNLHSYQPAITWDFAPDGELILSVFQMGNIIHPEQWARTCDVSYLLAYHEETDSFICSSGKQIYAYKRCNLEDMVSKAKDLLAGFELSDSQKTYYGLD